MTPRERFQAVMEFRPFDRLPLVEWATWWNLTLRRWEGEGLPTGLDRYALNAYFGLEDYKQDWFHWFKNGMPPSLGRDRGYLPGDDYAAEYARCEPFLFPLEPHWPVNPETWDKWAVEQARGDSVLWFTVPGFFWLPRLLFGVEPHLYAFYDEPALMHRINEGLTNWILALLERVLQHAKPDFITFAEDLSYNKGPMLSDAMFREFCLPYYQRITPVLRRHGIYGIMDSDGDVTQVCPWLEEAGLDGILPLERKAGVDVVEVRKRHPRLRFLGSFDKLTMHRGEAAMRTEFERLLPAARAGGVILSVDHQTPPEVSLEDYRLYLRLYREYAGLAAR
jgi:hypothetical protein